MRCDWSVQRYVFSSLLSRLHGVFLMKLSRNMTNVSPISFFGHCSWIASNVTAAMLVKSEKFFWEFYSTIMHNLSYFFLLFRYQQPSYHVSAIKELKLRLFEKMILFSMLLGDTRKKSEFSRFCTNQRPSDC